MGNRCPSIGDPTVVGQQGGRQKYLIQWREQKEMRLWEPCPSDRELVDDKYKWRSFREPTASEQADGTQQNDHTDNSGGQAQDDSPERSRRFKRGQRQVQLRDSYRVWVESREEASVEK